MDEDDAPPQLEHLFRAIQHVTGYAQTQIGLQLESNEIGLERRGELNLDKMEDW